MLTIKHLKIFQAVAECKSMSKAANKLYLSQPSISQAISDIEKYYKVKLFDRYPKELYITPAGKKLLRYTNNLLYKFNAIENLDLANEDQIDVRIGATDTAASCILNHVINNSKKANNKLNFYVNIDNTSTLECKLLKNEIDFAIIEGQIESNDIIKIPIADDCLVLVCSNKHPLAGIEKITASDLQNQDFIVREKGSGTRAIFENIMFANNINYNITWECSSFNAIKQAVINNQGIGLISARLIADEFVNNEIRVIKNRNFVLKRDFYLCYHKSKSISKPLQTIIDTALSYHIDGIKCPVFNEDNE